jgi:hypothetical protein
LICQAYHRAGISRPGKYFRFPYIDRGDGDLLERRFNDLITAVEQGDEPHIPSSDAVSRLQTFLKAQGFIQPFRGVRHPLYAVPAVAEACDCLFTYSTGDWMLNARHRGTQPYQSKEDLIRAMEDDPYLLQGDGPQIILMHDHAEIIEPVLALVDHLLNRDTVFLEIRE